MANWVSNILTVVGSDSRVEEVKKYLKNEECHFNKVADQLINSEDTFWFETKWSGGGDITLELSKIFPDLTFVLEFECFEDDFSGYAIYKNGEQVEYKEGMFDDHAISDHSWTNEDEDEDEEGEEKNE